MKKILLYTSLILMSIILSLEAADNLRYGMQKDKIYKYLTLNVSKTTVEMMGQEMITSAKDSSILQFQVLNIAEGGDLLMHGSYLSNLMVVKNPRVDTTLEMKDWYGKNVEVLLSPLGKTKKVAAIDTFPKVGFMRMSSADPSLAFRRILPKLPSTAVGVGDTWMQTEPDTLSVSGMQMISRPNLEYTIIGEEKMAGFDCYKISFSGDMALNGTGNQMGADFVIEGEGKSEGTLHFAPKEGLLIAVDTISDQDMTIAVTGGMNMTIPQTQSTTTEVRYLP